MGIIGSVVGGLAGIGGAIGAGIAGRKAYKKNMGILNDMRQDSQNWYDREYNSDFTQRADAQAALNNARRILDERYRRAEGAAAVAGASDESVALQKQAANEVLGDVTSDTVGQAEAYKEGVRNNYVNQQTAFNQAEMDLNSKKAANVATQAAGLATAAGGLGDAFGDGVLRSTKLGKWAGVK